MKYSSVTVYLECDGDEHVDSVVNESAFGTSEKKAIERLKRMGWWVDLESGRCLCPMCTGYRDD